MKNLLFLSFLLLAFRLQAQTGSADTMSNNPEYQLLIGNLYNDPGIFHSGIYFRYPYLPGKVYFNTGDSIGGVYLRYNSKDDLLLWLNKAFGQIKLEKPNISAFKLYNNDTVYFFRKMKFDVLHDTSGHFYQECINNKIQLFAERKVTEYSSYYSKNIRFFKYKPQPRYILILNGKEILIDKPKVKKLYAQLPQEKQAILEHIRRNNLRINSETGFIDLLLQLEDILTD